jgi:hypothetical protein
MQIIIKFFICFCVLVCTFALIMTFAPGMHRQLSPSFFVCWSHIGAAIASGITFKMVK